jgi:hypothetical protein
MGSHGLPFPESRPSTISSHRWVSRISNDPGSTRVTPFPRFVTFVGCEELVHLGLYRGDLAPHLLKLGYLALFDPQHALAFPLGMGRVSRSSQTMSRP